jgi:hypothetical protein
VLSQLSARRLGSGVRLRRGWRLGLRATARRDNERRLRAIDTLGARLARIRQNVRVHVAHVLLVLQAGQHARGGVAGAVVPVLRTSLRGDNDRRIVRHLTLAKEVNAVVAGLDDAGETKRQLELAAIFVVASKGAAHREAVACARRGARRTREHNRRTAHSATQQTAARRTLVKAAVQLDRRAVVCPVEHVFGHMIRAARHSVGLRGKVHNRHKVVDLNEAREHAHAGAQKHRKVVGANHKRNVAASLQRRTRRYAVFAFEKKKKTCDFFFLCA